MTSTATLATHPIVPQRGWVLGVAIAAIILGIVGLILPGASLLTVAVLFGINLLVLGASRIILAFTSTDLGSGSRWFMGLLGVAILAAAVLCLSNPFRSLQVLGFVIGFGWIFEGTVGIVGGIRGYTVGARWVAIVTGVLFFAAGIIIMTLPVLALAVFVTTGAVMLIVLGAASLFSRPRRSTSSVSATNSPQPQM